MVQPTDDRPIVPLYAVSSEPQSCVREMCIVTIVFPEEEEPESTTPQPDRWFRAFFQRNQDTIVMVVICLGVIATAWFLTAGH